MPPCHKPRCLALLLGLFASIGLACATWEKPPIAAAPPSAPAAPLACPASGTMRLVTLNLAHGRGLAFHQSLVANDAFAGNIATVGALLRQSCADVVALQEADGPSSWSGNFDHVATLTSLGDFHAFFRGTHAKTQLLGLDVGYGTALISRGAMRGAASQAFDTSWHDTKGYVRAAVTTPERPGVPVEVVSVHLDPLSAETRRAQIRMLAQELGQQLGTMRRPLVVMGDLNCDAAAGDDCVGDLAEQLHLRAYDPQVELATYPAEAPRKRIDWILISEELEFVGYRVLEAEVSDHRAVLADVRWRKPAGVLAQNAAPSPAGSERRAEP